MKTLLQAQERILLEKGLGSNDPAELIKATLHYKDIAQHENANLKSYFVDPYDLKENMGYRDKSYSLTYQTLRRMAKTPILRAIIGTRIEQVAQFLIPQTSRFQPGFVIRKKQKWYLTPEERSAEPSDREKARAEQITNFILNCGLDVNAWHGDNFETFGRKYMDDSLTLDQGTFEVVRNRGGDPAEFIATDGATFRIAESFDDDNYNGPEKEKINGYYPSYVQIHMGRVLSEFYPWELCFGIRNQKTNIYNNGYGVSEIEDLINVVTWMLNGDTYNGKFFTQGSAPKGILKVGQGANPDAVAQLRQAWTAMVQGAANAHKTLIVEGSDATEWLDMQKNNRDMEFGKWQEYLIKLSCAIYKIDPAEIGFPMSSGGTDKAPMFEGNNEAKLKYSRDKGLKPLLMHFQSIINKYVVKALDPNYEFVFVGLDGESEVSDADLTIKKVASYVTINEARKKDGLPPIEGGDIPANPTFVQAKNAEQQNKMNGSQESNQFVDFNNGDGGGDDEEQQQDNQQPQGMQGEEGPQDQFNGTEKSELSNPMLKELDTFLKREYNK